MTLIEDITGALVTGGHATALGTDVFPFAFIDLPTNQIIIILGGGKEPIHVSGGDPIDQPALYIQVRNSSKQAAYAKAEAIRQYLDGLDIGAMTVWTTRSAPVYLGQDEGTLRHRFSVDFYLVFER